MLHPRPSALSSLPGAGHSKPDGGRWRRKVPEQGGGHEELRWRRRWVLCGRGLRDEAALGESPLALERPSGFALPGSRAPRGAGQGLGAAAGEAGSALCARPSGLRAAPRSAAGVGSLAWDCCCRDPLGALPAGAAAASGGVFWASGKAEPGGDRDPEVNGRKMRPEGILARAATGAVAS